MPVSQSGIPLRPSGRRIEKIASLGFTGAILGSSPGADRASMREARARGPGLAGDLPGGHRPRGVHRRVRAGPPLAVAGERAHRLARAPARRAAAGPHPSARDPDRRRGGLRPARARDRRRRRVGSSGDRGAARHGPAQPVTDHDPLRRRCPVPGGPGPGDVRTPRSPGGAGRGQLARRRTPVRRRRCGVGRAAEAGRSDRERTARAGPLARAAAGRGGHGPRTRGRTRPRPGRPAGPVPAARVPCLRRRSLRHAAPAGPPRAHRAAAGHRRHPADTDLAGRGPAWASR